MWEGLSHTRNIGPLFIVLGTISDMGLCVCNLYQDHCKKDSTIPSRLDGSLDVPNRTLD